MNCYCLAVVETASLPTSVTSSTNALLKRMVRPFGPSTGSAVALGITITKQLFQ